MPDTIIKGVHGRALLRKPNNENDFWRLEHIYQGPQSVPTAVRVPNVGDIVIDTTGGYPKWFEVQFVDDTTLIPVLAELNKTGENTANSDFRLLGIGPGYQSELWRLFLDTSVIPHVYAVDSRLWIHGKDNTKYKIFQGTDTSAVTGKVISMNFNANAELIGEDLPLELIAFAGTDVVDHNVAVKHPRGGYTTTKLQNGDVVTLVTYNERGIQTSYNVLIVHNTALDRRMEASTKYVTSISIDSPFLDKTENNTLLFPMNIPRDAISMMGVISYSDGSVKRMPIDGERLVLGGLDNYVPMKKDQVIKLALTYYLPEGEMALNASVGNERFISVRYFGRTLQVEGSYSVNLVPIPTYINELYGWSIKWLLYSLDRDVVYDVTNVVKNGANTTPLDPKLFNNLQDITVSIDLSKVDNRLKSFIHVQSFKIALMGKPTVGTTTPWLIYFEKDQNPAYGANIILKGVRDKGLSQWNLDISCGATSLDDWLERVYYRSKPLINAYKETQPPKPTHFVLTIGDRKVTYPVGAWNSVLTSAIGGQDGYGAIIQWVRVDGGTQYQLGASPVCFIDVSEGGVLNHAGSSQPAQPDNNLQSTVIDIPVEVQKIIDRKASTAVVEKYRDILTKIKRLGLLKYEAINALYQRIRTLDTTPAQIANDVIRLEEEVNKITISEFNRDTDDRVAPPSMEQQGP